MKKKLVFMMVVVVVLLVNSLAFCVYDDNPKAPIKGVINETKNY